MKPTIIYALTIALLGGIFADAALATSMRCGSHIISDGQLTNVGKYEVLKRCGEPTERFGDTWVYDHPGQLKRTLRFGPDGELSAIEAG